MIKVGSSAAIWKGFYAETGFLGTEGGGGWMDGKGWVFWGMEFKAKLVLPKKNPGALIAAAGVVFIIVSGGLTAVPKQIHHAEVGLVIGFALLILGVIRAQGNISFEEVSDQELVVGEDSIQVGMDVYKLSELESIVFDIDGYDGMVAEGQVSSRGYPIYINGMDNYLDFIVGQKKQEWQFYMPGPDWVRALGALYKVWYEKGVPFEERTKNGGRTFMFEPVSGEEDLEDRKKLLI